MHFPAQPAPDRAWVERIRAGDRTAFEALFRSLYPTLCAAVARRVDSAAIAEELVQDVFLGVWERRERLDPDRSVTRYLYRAARNRALNHLKHRRISDRSQTTITLSLHPSIPTPEDHLHYSELLSATNEAIEGLPVRCREIFLLSRHGNLRYSEIAELLGLSVKTVETQMGRALKALRVRLRSHL